MKVQRITNPFLPFMRCSYTLLYTLRNQANEGVYGRVYDTNKPQKGFAICCTFINPREGFMERVHDTVY